MTEVPGKARRIETVGLGLVSAFFLAALALVFWATLRAPAVVRRADNPRVVDAELAIRRGRILDANGVVLAETVAHNGAPARSYPISSIGPAVGYYSFRHGTAGIEQGYDDVLRGDDNGSWAAVWRDALHRPREGQDVRMTIDADWQRSAAALMQGHMGALLIVDVTDGAILSMVSQPGYNPNELDAEFDELAEEPAAPLLNRVTHGFYQPGLALQPFILAAAMDQGDVRLDEAVENAHSPLMVRDTLVRCRETPPQEATWATALQMACPGPMLALAPSFTPEALTGSLASFGFYSQPAFQIPTSQVTSPVVSDKQYAILGQERLAVTPLQMARAWVALANQGRLSELHLVREVQNPDGTWQTRRPEQGTVQAVAPEVAATLTAALTAADGAILEHASTALSGPDDAMIAWYLGFRPAQQQRYAVVVVMESAANATTAQQIGRAALQLTAAAN